MTALDRVVEALEACGCTVKRSGHDTAMSQCPAHEDREPSLSLRQIRGSALVKCHAGCDTRDVLAAVGLTEADLFDDKRGVDYRYSDGRVVSRRVGKKFHQSPGIPTHVLYVPPGLNLAAVIEQGHDIYIPEGEKDVDLLASMQLPAVTSPMGAANWEKADYTPLAHAKRLVVIQDRDEPGHERAVGLYRHLREITEAEVVIIEAAEGKDAADHFMSGLTLEQFKLVPSPSLDDYDPELEPQFVDATEKILPIEWAWKGIVPMGGLTLLVGTGGIGKTTFAMWLLSMFQQGRLPGKLFGQKHSVLMIGSEDSWQRTILPRFIAAGGERSDRFRKFVMPASLIKQGIKVPQLPEHLAIIERAIVVSGAKVVFIDPILSLMNASLSSDRAPDVRQALDPLNEMAERLGVTILAVSHMNKNVGGSAASRLSGSHAWRDVARSTIVFAKDEDAEAVVLSNDKNNLAKDSASYHYRVNSTNVQLDAPDDDGSMVMSVPVVQWLGPCERTVDDVFADELANGRSGELKREILDFVLHAPSVVSVKEVADEMDDRIGATLNATKLALGRLSKAGRIQKYKRGVYGPPLRSVTSEVSSRGGANYDTLTLSYQNEQVKVSEVSGVGRESTDTNGVGVKSVSDVESVKLCDTCGGELHWSLVARGVTTHPTCLE